MDRILIVDDEPENILLAQTALERAGFEVIATTDPRQAAHLAAQREPDAVVLDLVMPDRSGFDVLSELRADTRTRSIPILFLSSRAEVSDRVRGLREGADDYLGKPFHPEELVLRLERLLAARAALGHDLEGSLDELRIAETIQAVVQGGKDGLFLVTTESGGGRLALSGSRIVEARFGRLTGPDALLAILGLRAGRFRFLYQASAGEPAAARESLDLRAAIFEAAWLDDEIASRAVHLPDPDAPLEARALDLQGLPEVLAEPLVERVHALVAASPGLCLRDLLREPAAAPAALRLATAWLIENGGLVQSGAYST